jgi:hypothetical protein
MNKLVIPLLLATAAFATPASANWFHNPYIGINRNIGSAPNPTPADIREMRLPVVTKAETPMLNYTVVEPAKDSGKTADATPPANTVAQASSTATTPPAAPAR